MDDAVTEALRNRTTPPSWDDTTEAAWLSALTGPNAELARQSLEISAEAEVVFHRLRCRWPDLNPDCRSWLLRWGACCKPVVTLELLERALTDPHLTVQLTAAEVVGQMGPAAALLRPQLAPLLSCADFPLRAAAARAGAAGGDWRRWSHHGETLELRLVGIARLSEDEGERCIPDLATLVCDPDWQVRAAAAEALVRLVDQAATHVRGLLRSDDPAVRVAAARVLIALGRDEWLQDDVGRG